MFQITLVFLKSDSVTTALRFPRPGPPAAVFPGVTGTTRALRRPAMNTALLMYSLRRPHFPSPSVRSHAAETSAGPGPALEPRHHWLLEMGRSQGLPGSWRVYPIPLPRSTIPAGPAGLTLAVALHVKPDKTPELKRETFTA